MEFQASMIKATRNFNNRQIDNLEMIVGLPSKSKETKEKMIENQQINNYILHELTRTWEKKRVF